MNKYQEAIDYLKGGNLFGELSNDALGDIEELVDRATPMKPIKLGDNKFSCKSCAMAFTVKNLKDRFLSHTYCDVCGQKLDWSEDDAKT